MRKKIVATSPRVIAFSGCIVPSGYPVIYATCSVVNEIGALVGTVGASVGTDVEFPEFPEECGEDVGKAGRAVAVGKVGSGVGVSGAVVGVGDAGSGVGVAGFAIHCAYSIKLLVIGVFAKSNSFANVPLSVYQPKNVLSVNVGSDDG